jgi:hypothetical protein
MLDYQLHPYVNSHRGKVADQWKKLGDADDVTASMWCNITDDPYAYADKSGGSTEQLPAAIVVSLHPAAGIRDVKALKRMKTATGYVGEHVMAWAAAYPGDAQVPRLLHIVVMSTRGGCLDANSSKLSRAAFLLLHSKYQSSKWASRTPYWY